MGNSGDLHGNSFHLCILNTTKRNPSTGHMRGAVTWMSGSQNAHG